jgi:hypothetical protein
VITSWPWQLPHRTGSGGGGRAWLSANELRGELPPPCFPRGARAMYHHHQHLLSGVAAATANTFRELAGFYSDLSKDCFPTTNSVACTATTISRSVWQLPRPKLSVKTLAFCSEVVRSARTASQQPTPWPEPCTTTTKSRPVSQQPLPLAGRSWPALCPAGSQESRALGPLCYYVLFGPPPQASVLLRTTPHMP